MNFRVAQQPTGRGIMLPVVTTVRQLDSNNKMVLCSVIGIDEDMEDVQKATKIRLLNSDKEFTVSNSSIAPIYKPEPSDILQHPNNTNKNIMTDIMTQGKLNDLWKTLDSDFSEDE